VERNEINTYYRLRPVFILNSAPMFTLTDRISRASDEQTLLMSLPMLSRYSGTNIDNLPFQRLVFKMKENTDKQDLVNLVSDLQEALD